MRLPLLTISALFFFTFSGTASEQSRIEELHNQAYQLLDTDLDAAMILADSSLLLAQKAGLAWEEANSYYIKGYIHDERNELPKAFVTYLKAANIFNGLNDEKSAKNFVVITVNIGGILTKYCKYDEAIELYEEALIKANENKITFQVQKLLYNKAFALRKKGDLLGASEALKESVDLAFTLQDTSRIIRCFNLLGLVHKDGEQYTDSREYFNYIIQHPKASDKDRALALHNTGITYREQNKVDSAKYFYDQALAIERTLNQPSVSYITLHGLAEWHLDHGDIKDAQGYAMEAESLYPMLTREPDNYDIFHVSDKIHREFNDINKAGFYSDRYYEESKAFNQEREELIKQLRQFQMDLILAGIETEQMANEQKSKAALYRWLALLGGILVILVWIGWKTWFNNHRRQLGRKVKTIMNEFEPKL